MSGGSSNGLWAHPPLPPGKRISDRPSIEDRKSTFGFIRKFPSVRRNSRKESMTDTTYESFDSLFDDNDIVLVGTEYYDNMQDSSDSSSSNTKNRKPFTSMFRSRSDGNLAGRSSSTCGGSSVLSRDPAELKGGFTKYLRALSGSWKNLLNSK